MRQHDDVITFDVVELLSRNIASIVLCAIVFYAVAYSLSLLLPNRYTSRASVYVRGGDSGDDIEDVSYHDLRAGTMLTSDIIRMITSENVKSSVLKDIDDVDPDTVTIKATTGSRSRFIAVTVTSNSRKVSAQCAGAIADEVVIMSREVMGIDDVRVLYTSGDAVELTGPPRRKIAVMGAVVGAATALVFGILRFATDKVTRDTDIEDLVGVPVIAHFSVVDRRKA